MNTSSFKRDVAINIASKMSAGRGGRPCVAFIPYMPSVYPVGRTPYFVDAMPAWVDTPEKEAQWQDAQVTAGGIVVVSKPVIKELT